MYMRVDQVITLGGARFKGRLDGTRWVAGDGAATMTAPGGGGDKSGWQEAEEANPVFTPRVDTCSVWVA